MLVSWGCGPGSASARRSSRKAHSWERRLERRALFGRKKDDQRRALIVPYRRCRSSRPCARSRLPHGAPTSSSSSPGIVKALTITSHDENDSVHAQPETLHVTSPNADPPLFRDEAAVQADAAVQVLQLGPENPAVHWLPHPTEPSLPAVAMSKTGRELCDSRGFPQARSLQSAPVKPGGHAHEEEPTMP